MNNRQKGFTLIELMVVLAIIAILAIIAVPQVQGHLARTQFSEGLGLADGLKSQVGEYYASRGKCPVNDADGFDARNDYAGKYVAGIELGGSAPACTIVVSFADADINSNLQGQSMTLTSEGETGSLRWTCTTTVPLKYVPAVCGGGE